MGPRRDSTRPVVRRTNSTPPHGDRNRTGEDVHWAVFLESQGPSVGVEVPFRTVTGEDAR